MTFSSFIYKDKKINNKTENNLTFVITYHPRLKILQKLIDKNLYLLYMNEELKMCLQHLNFLFHIEAPAKPAVI